MTSLFDRYQLGNLTPPNRLVMAPMTRARAEDGKPTASTATYYAQRATDRETWYQGGAVGYLDYTSYQH